MLKIIFINIYALFVAARRRYYTWRAKRIVASYGASVKVNGRCTFTPTTRLGNNTNFNGIEITGYGAVIIGDNFHSGRECQILTSIHNYDHGTTIPYDTTYLSKDVIIEDNVWLGNRVIVLGGAHIGEGAIIQAGSVVVGKIPPHAIAGGHPARMFKCRDTEHYERLKKAGLFH